MTLSYTGIGFVDGDTCPITLDDREHDGAAASQLLRFLGGDPSIVAVDDDSGDVVVDQVIREDATTGTRYDPAVGMTGGSYGGQIQFAAAALRARPGHRPAGRDHPADHLERPGLLAGPREQRPAAGHRPQRLGDLGADRRLQVPVGRAVHLGRRRQRRGGRWRSGDPADFEAYIDNNCANFDEPVCRRCSR